MDTALPQKSLKGFFSNALFPELCLHCSQKIAGADLVCADCSTDGLLKPAAEVPVDDGLTRRFSFSYEGVGKTLFKAAKFAERRRAVKFLSTASRESLVSLSAGNAVLVAMPSRRKFLRRLLEVNVAKEKLVFNAFTMKRKLFSRDANKSLGEAERYKRIYESLALNAAVLPAADRYVLCDDVSTTGATLNQAAFLLQNNGIRKDQIVIWALMHRPRYFLMPRQ